MSKRSKQNALEQHIKNLSRNIKTTAELEDLTRLLRKTTLEAMLEGEMETHLGYAKHASAGHHSGNSRNGYRDKTLKGEQGEIAIEVPRDRNGEFEPLIVPKGQTRLAMFNDKIIALYSKGMSTRDIAATLLALYRGRGLTGIDFSCHRTGAGTGAGMAVPAVGCGLPHRVSGLYRCQNPPGQTGHQ